MRRLQALHPNHVARRPSAAPRLLGAGERTFTSERPARPPAGAKPSCGPGSGSTTLTAPTDYKAKDGPTMESAEIAPPLPALLRGAWAHRRALGQPDRRGPDAAAGQRGHGAVQAVLPGPAKPPPYARATSVQKCVRTPDIDEVGKTTRHATFFQMLGNFSFGDYFKDGAIPFAWELLTKPESEGGFGFPEDRLWVDRLPRRRRGRSTSGTTRSALPAERIQRRGLDDNYWHMGVPGPGGPCSEIYYDRGPEYGREGGPDRRRGPLPRGLEPRLHAVPARRGPHQGGLRHPRRAARQEHRHRHGPGAHGGDPAGRRQHLRDRHHLQDPRPGRRAHQDALRPRPARRRLACGSSPTTSAPA